MNPYRRGARRHTKHCLVRYYYSLIICKYNSNNHNKNNERGTTECCLLVVKISGEWNLVEEERLLHHTNQSKTLLPQIGWRQQRFFSSAPPAFHRPLLCAPLGRQSTVRYNKLRVYSNHHAIWEVYIQHHQHGDQWHHAACSWLYIPGNYQHHPCESKHVRYVRKVHFSKAEKKQSEH